MSGVVLSQSSRTGSNRNPLRISDRTKLGAGGALGYTVRGHPALQAFLRKILLRAPAQLVAPSEAADATAIRLEPRGIKRPSAARHTEGRDELGHAIKGVRSSPLIRRAMPRVASKISPGMVVSE
jgi:hypothetical protein